MNIYNAPLVRTRRESGIIPTQLLAFLVHNSPSRVCRTIRNVNAFVNFWNGAILAEEMWRNFVFVSISLLSFQLMEAVQLYPIVNIK